MLESARQDAAGAENGGPLLLGFPRLLLGLLFCDRIASFLDRRPHLICGRPRLFQAHQRIGAQARSRPASVLPRVIYAPMAVVSESAALAVIARAMPVVRRCPVVPSGTLTVLLAGTVMVSTGTSVPTVGALALL